MADIAWIDRDRDADSSSLALLNRLWDLRFRRNRSICILLSLGHVARPGLTDVAGLQEA
jgi:hypothetical protein